VAETADRVVVMYCGQVVEEASAEQLFERPMHPYTLGLLQSIPTMEDTETDEPLYMIRGMVPNPLNLPKGCAFAPRCDRRTARCAVEVPELVEVDGHKLRCFRFEPGCGCEEKPDGATSESAPPVAPGPAPAAGPTPGGEAS
jgi:peptide/nickel transport system ATP-binding protein